MDDEEVKQPSTPTPTTDGKSEKADTASPVTDNPYATSNLLKEKGRCVFLKDFEFMAARKEIKNDRSFRSVSLRHFAD